MKKILFVLFSLCLVLTTSCGNDDEPSYDLTLEEDELAQTTWKANQSIYDVKGNETYSRDFTLEFEHASLAAYLLPVDGKMVRRWVEYHIDNKIVKISTQADHALSGSWTLTEKKKNRLVFQAYLPEKSILTLEREL
jgi:hypothetical protein